jgi:signal transduction histidine kinase
MNRTVLSLISVPVFAIAGVAAYLWTNETGAKVGAYAEMRTNINKVEYYSKLLKLELLKIHDGVVLNYTTLNKYKPLIEEIIQRLKKNSALDSDQVLYFRFEDFISSRIAETTSVEAFKTVSSLYRNSETNFAEQSEAILQGFATRARLDAASSAWLRRYVKIARDLRNDTIVASTDVAEEMPQERSTAIDSKRIANMADPMEQALAHGERAIQLNNQIRVLINEMFSAYYDDTYLALLDHIDKRLEEYRSEAASRKTYLAACVVLLCLMVFIVIALLVRTLRQVRDAKIMLEDRVIERTRELTEKSDELKDYKDRLEEQVDARTKELNRKAQELVTALIKEQQYSNLQKDFVSMISHEFRTPVAIIDMAAQRILRKKPEALEPAAIEEFATGVRKNTRRLTGLIDRTLTSSKFREGHLEFTASKLNLTKLLGDICAQQRKFDTGNAIHTLIDPDIPEISGDPAMLEQVFSNLIGNAIKYSPEKTPVVVRVLKNDEFVRVEVIDQGIGIPEKELPKLFERYFRASNARVIAGTGLGLAITKEMIELHGGSLHVTTSEHKGSAFIAMLPIDGPRATGAEAAFEQSDVA